MVLTVSRCTAGSEHISLRSLPGMAERSIRIGSAGKTFSFTAWKVRPSHLRCGTHLLSLHLYPQAHHSCQLRGHETPWPPLLAGKQGPVQIQHHMSMPFVTHAGPSDLHMTVLECPYQAMSIGICGSPLQTWVLPGSCMQRTRSHSC